MLSIYILHGNNAIINTVPVTTCVNDNTIHSDDNTIIDTDDNIIHSDDNIIIDINDNIIDVNDNNTINNNITIDANDNTICAGDNKTDDNPPIVIRKRRKHKRYKKPHNPFAH